MSMQASSYHMKIHPHPRKTHCKPKFSFRCSRPLKKKFKRPEGENEQPPRDGVDEPNPGQSPVTNGPPAEPGTSGKDQLMHDNDSKRSDKHDLSEMFTQIQENNNK